MPRQLTDKQKAKVKKILQIIELGDLALAKLIFELEDKWEEKYPEILSELDRLENKKYKLSTKGLKKVAKMAADMLEKPKIAQQAVKLVDTDEIAQKAAKLVKMPKMPKKVTKVIEKHVVHEQPIVTNEIKEVAVEETPEQTRDKLESLKGEERLRADAIDGIEELEERLNERIQKLPKMGGKVSMPPAAINRIAEDGDVKYTGTGILNFGAGLDVSVSGNVINVISDQTEEVVDYIDFDTTASYTSQEGRLGWDSDEGTLQIGMPGGEVNLQIGQEALVRVSNKSGSDIANGKLVYATGSQGNRLTIDLADNTDSDKIHILGMTTEDIDNNGNGFVATFGKVRGSATQPIDTSSFSEGDKLYLDTAGGYTATHPSSSINGVVIVGTVLKVHATDGVIQMSNPQEFTIGNDFDGTLRQSVINKNTGTSAASGFTAVNDAGHFTTMGIAGSGNTTFQDAGGQPVSVYYAPGYGDHWQAVDGAKDFVWFTDPTDSHNNSSLSYERMRLESDGTLSVGATDYETLVTDDDDIPNKKYVDDQDALYLKLDASNDPITGELQIGNDTTLNHGINATPSAAYGLNSLFSTTDTTLTTGKRTYVDFSRDITGGVSEDYMGEDLQVEVDGDLTGGTLIEHIGTNVYLFTRAGGLLNGGLAHTFSAGKFIANSNSSTVGTVGATMIGVNANAQGSFDATVGSHKAFYATASGAADSNYGIQSYNIQGATNNYGVWSSAAGAGTNWSFYNGGGNMFMGDDNEKSYWGTAQDVEMYYDNTKFVIDDTATQEIDFADNNLTTSGNINLSISLGATPAGIIYKGANRWLHDFEYGNNGLVTPVGDNVFLGENAGNFTMGSTATSTSEASRNVGIGSASLQSNTTGYENVAIGLNTLTANTTGYGNFALGSQSMTTNTTGIGNVGIGRNTIKNNSTLSYNVGIGENALQTLTAGGNNVAIGFLSGRYFGAGVDSLTDATDGIYIGDRSRASADGLTNEVVIGADAIGSGSNTITLGGSAITGVHLPNDNQKLYFGASNDDYITHDGTDFVIQPNSNKIKLGSAGSYYLSTQAAGSQLYLLTLTRTSGTGVGLVTNGSAQIGGSTNGYILKRNTSDGIFEINGTQAGFTGFRIKDETGATSFSTDDNLDVHIPNDSKKLYFGTADDTSITFDGSDMIIASENVTANDELIIKDFDAVNVQDDLYFSGSGTGLPFGEIYAYEVGTTITISGSGIANKVQVTAFDTDGQSNLATPDHTNDHITINKAGKYLVTVSMSLESTGGSAYTLSGGVWCNNGATQKQNVHMSRTLSGGGGDTGSTSMSGICDFAENDTVELWVWNETNTNNVIVDDVTLSITQIGG